MGESTRLLADLTAPLAPGRSRGTGSEVSSPFGAREPKGLRRRLRPLRPGFRVCSTTAHALRAPGKPGSLSTACNGQGGEAPELLHKKGTRNGCLFYGVFFNRTEACSEYPMNLCLSHQLHEFY